MIDKQYSVKKTPSSRNIQIISFSIACLIPSYGIIGILAGVNDMGSEFIIIWAVAIFALVLSFLYQTSEIIINQNSEAIFCNLFGRHKSIPLSEIKEIRNRHSSLLVKTDKGKFRSNGDFNNFSRFVLDVKKHNNSVITKGC